MRPHTSRANQRLPQLVLTVFVGLAHVDAVAAQTEGVISTRPICFPASGATVPCPNQYIQGPTPIRLTNGDVVILVDVGYGLPGAGGEAVVALQYPAGAGISPRWYPIYGTNNWGLNPSLNETQNAWPSALYYFNSWRITSTLTGPPNVGGRVARTDVPNPTSQPAFLDRQWLKPNPPCEPLGSCGAASTGFDFAVTSPGGTVHDYHLEQGTNPTCSNVPDSPPYTIGYIRHRINSDLTYTADGCITFPRPGNTYTPLQLYDISRGSDGKYYMLASHFPFQNWFQEFVSTDGLSFTYNNKMWQIVCASVSPDPNCGVPLTTSCFTGDGAYLRDSNGVIVDTNPTLPGEQRVIVGSVGNDVQLVDGSWRLYYWADSGALLPATWGQEAPSCPPPNVVAAGQPSYQGNFDGFTPDMLTASGWAWDWYQPNATKNVDVLVDGALFTTLSASVYLPYLANPADPDHYYYGNGIHGWSWPIASFFRDGIQHTVDIRYSGTSTSQSNSPRTYKIAAPSSLSASPSSVTGGASSTATITLTQAAPSSGLTVKLSSSDAAASLPATKLVTGTSGSVTVTTAAVAGVTPVTLRASSGNVTKSTTLTINPSGPAYGGNFDGVNCDVIAGWAWNASFPNTPIFVDIFEGSTPIALRVQANIYRPDLFALGYGNGIHGFSIPLPLGKKNNQPHTITVKFAGTSQLLSNGTKTVTCARLDHSLTVDSSANGVMEPGETVTVNPRWQNNAGAAVTLTGTASNFGSPLVGSYTILDAAADYKTVQPGSVGDCNSAPANCYRMTASVSGGRPASHWDASFLETLSPSQVKTWVLHIGASFTDVSTSSVYYSGIETVLHKGITAGCGAGTAYCPADSVTRAQMAVFLVKAKYGASFVPPPAIGIFGDVAPGSFGADYIEQLYRDGVTAGCGGGNYCPTSVTNRNQMAVFLLKTKFGPTYDPPAACGCVFSDVHAGDFADEWIEALQTVVNGVAPGYCGAGKYCPTAATTREQMATFIAKTFALTIYGP